MEAFLKISQTDRKKYFLECAGQLHIPLPPAAIEKDFWVCFILKILFSLPVLTNKITFKGGTSLSKGWGLIDRFSEDIDIAVSRTLFGHSPPDGAENVTSNRNRVKRLSELENKSEMFFREILLPALHGELLSCLGHENFGLKLVRKGNEFNIEFTYPDNFKDELGGLLPVVQIELVPRAEGMPSEVRTIRPFIQEVFDDFFTSTPIAIPVLLPERTFLEKLFLLHETHAGFTKGLDRKSRHLYDVVKLFEGGILSRLINNKGLLNQVLSHRQIFYRYGALDYQLVLREGLNLVPDSETLAGWKGDYDRSSSLIYKDRPRFNELIDQVRLVEATVNEWILGGNSPDH